MCFPPFSNYFVLHIHFLCRFCALHSLRLHFFVASAQPCQIRPLRLPGFRFPFPPSEHPGFALQVPVPPSSDDRKLHFKEMLSFSSVSSARCSSFGAAVALFRCLLPFPGNISLRTAIHHGRYKVAMEHFSATAFQPASLPLAFPAFPSGIRRIRTASTGFDSAFVCFAPTCYMFICCSTQLHNIYI